MKIINGIIQLSIYANQSDIYGVVLYAMMFITLYLVWMKKNPVLRSLSFHITLLMLGFNYAYKLPPTGLMLCLPVIILLGICFFVDCRQYARCKKTYPQPKDTGAHLEVKTTGAGHVSG